ncbi:hypothetical protein DSL72_008678 [Monilinia vaccinii-corymbosi]|uniref:N-acetyltransferase domain-containing protein n=1 Tax=Monilinia vaccinii-corymbosi TaxID=61207 RepID=A0A8A3PR02_9HELO|nr:hypothetical protein DSL72_008678 [Monilinia vaccinii-corymbosi]
MPIQHHPINPTLTLNSTHPNHQNIILTRPRTSDAEVTIPAFNHPSIYLNLTGPPFPYTQESFDSFFHDVLDKNARIAAAELWDAKVAEEDGHGRRWVEAIPFPSIREVVVNGEGASEEIFIGLVEFRRRGYVTILEDEERERLIGINRERKTGDPKIEWEIGFWLLPTHHNRGIMPAILQTLLSDFAMPYMNMHTLIGEYLEYNVASRRVFEKCGFVFEGVTEGVEVIGEGKVRALREFLEREGRGEEGVRGRVGKGVERDWMGVGKGKGKGKEQECFKGWEVGVGCLRWERGEVGLKEQMKEKDYQRTIHIVNPRDIE